MDALTIPLGDAMRPVLEAYAMVTAVVPILGTLLVTLVCAALFVLMLALGLTVTGRAVYSAVLFFVILGLMAGSRRALELARRHRRPPFVVPLPNVRSFDVPAREVGHKAANLAAFAATGARVAMGWVVTADAFEKFLKANRIEPGPEEGAEFADRIRAGRVPRRILWRLHRQLRAAATDAFLLRSSFFDEDTADRAFPGVYESLPWSVDEGAAALATTLKEVWASYWSARAVEYRASAGAAGQGQRRLAVLVNVLIPHDDMGFGSSADVRTGYTERHLVEVATHDREATALHALLPNVIEMLATSPGAPTDRLLVREVSALAGRAEAAQRRPVEIEWGTHDGHVWIYQVRPLTSLPRRHTFTNSYVADVPRYPLTPLAWWFLFGDESPARLLGNGLELFGLGSFEDRDVLVHHGLLYLRWERFKPLFLGALRSDIRLRGSVRVAAAMASAWLRGADHVTTPPVPEPPHPGLTIEDLLERLERLRRDQLLRFIRRQARVVQAAAAVDGLLRQILGIGAVPAPHVVSPMQQLQLELESRPPGEDSRSAAELVQQVWYLTEREAEISALRAIDFPEAFFMRFGIGSDATTGETSIHKLGPRPTPLGGPQRWLVRIRDRLLTEREQMNACINATDYEARLIAERISARLAERIPEWEPADVFFLSPAEIGALAQGRAEMATTLYLVRHRRATHTRDASFDSPAILHLDDQGRTVEEPSLGLPADVITIGIALGGGEVRGVARVIRTGDWLPPEAAAGQIVVLPDPSAVWTAIASHAAGVLFARGGPLSHLAIWCRERGIPTVVAARGVYELVHDGDTIVVDGDRGEVRRA